MRAFPNCKINLGLQIVGRRPDGYHDLRTLFLPVDSFSDTLEILPLAPSAQAPVMQQTGLALDNPPSENICLKAWQLLHEAYSIPPVHIRLHKGIPFGAGLGGGSSDAAHTLRLLSSLFSLGLDDEALASFAAQLGADCPFFVRNLPAYAVGIGTTLSPLEADIRSILAPFDVRIEIPVGEHVSTREAYSGLQPQTFSRPRVDLREAILRPVEQWRECIENEFEASVFPLHPAVAALKEKMYAEGAVYASMTGSGAAVFGIFPR